MSLSKSKCLYSNNCLHFLKRAVPLTYDPKFEGLSEATAVPGKEKIPKNIKNWMPLDSGMKCLIFDSGKFYEIENWSVFAVDY
jgi:hypothetical protein